MSLHLLIDTALETAHIGIARNGELIAQRENAQQQDHATWLHPALREMLSEIGASTADLEAVGITEGPGSYTGLRVGMAAAKGICYAEKIPLIGISTLQLLAAGARDEAEELIIALIDARRDEVFAGIYDRSLNNIQPDLAMIPGPDSFADLRTTRRIALTGNGAAKTSAPVGTKTFFVIESKHSLKNLALLTYKKFVIKSFADLAYHEPVYVKDFYTTPKDR
ncbi:MAG: tRNA (adenosine(37)-N6)-threonylcarbamoyltransferase complex dimerization subunit type 1 TsaB [Bacteroidota bacterium]